MLCNVSNVFFLSCVKLLLHNCNLVYYKRDYRKELRRRNEIGQDYIDHILHISLFLYRYTVCVCLYVLCKFCSRLLQVFLVKEYKGCPMLNQNDFSDKIAIAFSVISKVFFIHQCHETCFYLPLSRGMITNMLSIQIVTNSCGTFLFRIVPQFLCLGLKYLYIFMITCYSVF